MQKYTFGNKSGKENKTHSEKKELMKNNILGVGITNGTKENILEYIVKNLENFLDNYYITTPNPEMLVLSRHSEDFRLALNDSKIALCDGIGLLWASRILGMSLKEQIGGTDFVESLCEKVKDWPINVGFLGAGPGVAEKTAECLKRKYPGLNVVFIGMEWEKGKIALGEEYLVSSISYLGNKNSSKKNYYIPYTKYHIPNTMAIDILFIAFGFPKQEFWMKEHLNKIPVKVMVGVGGAFDQIANPTLRPPEFIYSLGLAWLYRLIREPWRIKRQLKLIEFVWMVIEERFSK